MLHWIAFYLVGVVGVFALAIGPVSEDAPYKHPALARLVFIAAVLGSFVTVAVFVVLMVLIVIWLALEAAWEAFV